jgi:hypothetical protein
VLDLVTVHPFAFRPTTASGNHKLDQKWAFTPVADSKEIGQLF